MLTYNKVRLNNYAWDIFYNTVDSIQVIASDDMLERYTFEIHKVRSYRLMSIRTKHDYRTGRLVAFALAYGDKLDEIQRHVFISEEAGNQDIAELKYSCTSDFEEAGVAA